MARMGMIAGLDGSISASPSDLRSVARSGGRTVASVWTVGLAMIAVGSATAVKADPLSEHRWRSRVLVISAPSADDPRARAQRAIAAAAGKAMAERDLVSVDAYGDAPSAVALRKKLGLPEGAFRSVLIGKDGGAKLVATDPITAAQLASTIDAMPMRRDEMRR